MAMVDGVSCTCCCRWTITLLSLNKRNSKCRNNTHETSKSFSMTRTIAFTRWRLSTINSQQQRWVSLIPLLFHVIMRYFWPWNCASTELCLSYTCPRTFRPCWFKSWNQGFSSWPRTLKIYKTPKQNWGWKRYDCSSLQLMITYLSNSNDHFTEPNIRQQINILPRYWFLSFALCVLSCAFRKGFIFINLF